MKKISVNPLLKVRDLFVSVEGKDVLKGISLDVEAGRYTSSWVPTEAENRLSRMRSWDIRSTKYCGIINPTNITNPTNG